MQKAHDSSKNNAWKDYPDITTPILAAELNRNEVSVDTIDDRVVEMDTTKANQTDMLNTIASVSYNSSTGTFTFTKHNGSTITVDTDIEKITTNWDFDDDPTSAHYQCLVLTLEDGTVKYVDLSALLTQFEFTDSTTMAWTVSSSGEVSVEIKNGSVTENKLQPNFLADCRSARTGAETAKTAADADALVSEGYAKGTQNGQEVGPGSPYYHNNAEYFKNEAEQIAGQTLGGLSDVTITNPSEGQVLTYDATTGIWRNSSCNDSQSVSGNPISFTTQSKQTAKDVIVALEPIQASGTPTPSAPIPISGYTQIDLKGTGKNLLPLNLGTIKSLNTGGTWSGNIYTYNGITFTLNINADGIIESIDISGTASQQTEFSISENTYKLNAGNYFISGIPTGVSDVWLNVICPKSGPGWWIDSRIGYTGYAATVGEDNRPYYFRIRVGTNFTGSTTITPQIELGSTATAYEPYHSSADISLPLPSTIYGGSLDVETGVLTIDRGIVDLGDLSWVYVSGSASRFVCSNLTVPSPLNDDTIPNLKCTCYKADTANNIVAHNTDLTIGIYENLCVYDSNYTDADTFKTAVTGQKLVYELATPYTIQLTPQQVSLLQGANVITSNGTSVALIYREGETATLADVESLADSINKVAEIADGDKSADQITAGMFKGMVKANATAMANLGTAQVRDIIVTDTAPTVGSSTTIPDGTLIIVYE